MEHFYIKFGYPSSDYIYSIFSFNNQWMQFSRLLAVISNHVINKRLSYHRETTRRAMLANSCHVSRRVGVKARFQTAKVTFRVIQWHWQ